MKIICKAKDFYDFYSGIYRDNTLVFDRRNFKSYTKEEILNRYDETDIYIYMVLQICNTFWCFRVIPTKFTRYAVGFGYSRITDYSLKLLGTWKDYDVDRKLVSIKVFPRISVFSIPDKNYKEIIDTLSDDKSIDYIKQAIHTNSLNVDNYRRYYYKYTEITVNDLNSETKIPILQDLGLASVVDPLDTYLTFEEFFSKEKTSSERTESVNMTNTEKIESHGFDTVSSFRGKNKK